MFNVLALLLYHSHSTACDSCHCCDFCDLLKSTNNITDVTLVLSQCSTKFNGEADKKCKVRKKNQIIKETDLRICGACYLVTEQNTSFCLM